jgi:hypothetical protein
MDFSKWRPEILDETEYLVFHNYFVFVGIFFLLTRFTFSGPISFRYQCIVVYFRRLLSTVKMDYEENMENARYESMPRMMTLL